MYLSIVIPVYNEEESLHLLREALYDAMKDQAYSWQVVLVDDGSHDRSPGLLRKQYHERPDVTRIVLLRANAGQHAALTAGFEYSQGRVVITMDADLQNPPEEIHKLLAEIDKGHDYVGSIRNMRRDSRWRHWASLAMNWLREKITSIQMTDQGCMFRAYDREIIQAILDSRESQTFIPALAYTFAGNPVEVVVEHEERAAGESKYSLFKLIHLNFDLMTSFSIVPLQMFSMVGMGIAVISFLFVIYLGVRRLMIGPEVEGVFTLFAIAFFLIGILLFGIGMLGEYIGRIYVQVRQRPRFLVGTVLQPGKDSSDKSET